VTVWRILGDVFVRPDPPSLRRPRLPHAGPVIMTVVALLTALASYAYLVDRPGGFSGVMLLAVSLLTGAPLALLPRWPLAAWRIAWLLAIPTGAFMWAEPSLPWPWQPVQVLMFPVLLYAVATRHRRPVLLVVWALTAALTVSFINTSHGAGALVGITAVMVVGDQVRRRREAQHELAAEEKRVAAEQARRAVLEERTRIAREMHDVVAHHMSLIAVRAETAPYRLDGVSEPVQEEFAGIAAASREALTEMRRLLGVLRSESPDLATAPQPGLADVAELVEAARAAGVPVTLSSDVDDVPPAVGRSAYRIVQEALSNAGRHAPGVPVRVEIRVVREELDISVCNGPPAGAATPTSAGPRHGLIGMRERATALGGTLTAESTVDGGFGVRARLPLEAAR